MQSRKVFGVLAAACVCALAMPARAQVDQGQENAALFGTVDQNTTGINNGSLACAPTATYNSFVYLNNAFPSAGIGSLLGSGSVSAINTLAGDIPGGIPASGGAALAQGKTQYISDKGLSSKISVERLGDKTALDPNTAARFIADQLSKGQDVEMGFIWSNADGTPTSPASGHVVTITGIDYDETGQNGAMNIIDPWGGVALSGNLTVAGGNLLLGYTGGGAGPGEGGGGDNPSDAGFGAIAFITAESVVPEPSIALAMAGLLGLTLRQRVRRA